MPTGYTADVADGKVTDFRTFALRCARAFGATIMQRDDPLHEPPKPREVEDYYLTAVANATREVQVLAAMTAEEANDHAALAYGQALRERGESIARDTATRNRYNAMLAEVMAWTAPTPDHVELKTFMVEQLTTGRDFDTGFSHTAPERVSGPTWLAQQKADAHWRLSNAHESLAKEVERVEGANRWIAALYESLSTVSP